ncbi:MAG: hypothetical protein ACTS3F_09350 [Phycisphaerales bacterium]
MPIAALSLSIVAVCLAMYAAFAKPESPDAYERVVQELWETIEPTYQEFGLALPDSPPTTINEALEPLVRMSTSLDGTHGEQLEP